MSIELDNPLLSGQQLELSIDYSGIPQVAKSPPWKGGFIWDASSDGQPWVATAVQFEGCDLFWPCIDHPLREPQSLDMHIKVPAPLVAAANGRLVSVERKGSWNIYHWQSSRPVNTYAVSLNIGPYERLDSSYSSRYGYQLPLKYWHLPGSRGDAEKLFAEFPRVLDFFESVIGPYPFYDEKMGVVETPYLGMEHQTINAYGNNYKVGQYGFDWLLHHEFAHEWFGNQLTHNSQDDMWLHEGFGIYMQPLYAQYLHGDLAYHSYLYQQRLNIVNGGPLVTGKSRSEKDLEDDGISEDVYYKGSLVLHSLRELIGDKAFFAATTELVYGVAEPKPGNFAPINASTEDFITLVNHKVGKDLNWFFKVYLYQAKLPELLMARSGNNIEFSWLVENDLPFPMPLEISVDGKLVTLDMADKRGVVEAGENAVIIADPHSKILRHQPHFDLWRRTGRQYRDN
jgi:aminopeptidase N